MYVKDLKWNTLDYYPYSLKAHLHAQFCSDFFF